MQVPSNQDPMASELPQGRDADAIAGVVEEVADEQAGRGEAPNNQVKILDLF